MKKHGIKINGSYAVVHTRTKYAVVNPNFYTQFSVKSTGCYIGDDPCPDGPFFEDSTLLSHAKYMTDEKLVQDLKEGKTAEQYFRKIGWNSAYLSDEEFDTFVYNATTVFRYILETDKWNSTVINGHYVPSVMVVLILNQIIRNGHLDKITDGESFYNFCDMFTQREYEIMMKKESTYSQRRVYENCCFEAAKRIIEILNSDTEE